MHLYTDAAAGKGCGGLFGNDWFQLKWPPWALDACPPIAWFELVPVYVACCLWRKNWLGKRILFHCDN